MGDGHCSKSLFPVDFDCRKVLSTKLRNHVVFVVGATRTCTAHIVCETWYNTWYDTFICIVRVCSCVDTSLTSWRFVLVERRTPTRKRIPYVWSMRVSVSGCLSVLNTGAALSHSQCTCVLSVFVSVCVCASSACVCAVLGSHPLSAIGCLCVYG